MAIALPWGQLAQQLPLPDEREEFLRDKYSLLLLTAQTHLHDAGEKAAVRDSLSLLDQASAIGQPTRGYHELRAKCLVLGGDTEAARAEERLSAAPATVVTADDHFLQGELFRSADVGSGATELEHDAVERHRKALTRAEAEYRLALRSDPKHYWARFQLGRCLFALGRAPEAIETLSACIVLRPNSPWAYSARGLASALAGRPDTALDDLDQAVRLDPKFQPARLNRGVVYWLFDRDEDARRDFDAVLASPADQRLIEAAYYRGQLSLKRQQNRAALDDFSAVVAAQPDFRPAYWLRAETQFRLGNNESGIADLKQFVDLDRGTQAKRDQSEASVDLGIALRKMAHDLEGDARRQVLLRAAEQLEAGIAAGAPASIEAFQYLGTVYELLDSASRRLTSIHGASLCRPTICVCSICVVGRIQPRRNLNWLVPISRRRFRHAPDNAESRGGLGFVSAQTGNDNDARDAAGGSLFVWFGQLSRAP